VREHKTDRRSRRSRRLIVDALLALMLEKRFDRITVQEIIERADVGRSTFYAQFRNKEDVLQGEIERVFGQLHERHAAATAEPADRLLPSLELFRHVQETKPLYPALVRGLALDPHYQAVQRSLRDAVAQQLALTAGSRELAVPAEIVADYLAGAFLTLVHWWLEQGATHSPEQMAAYFQQLAMPGLRAVLHDHPR
jgi:AcrR family transcriptional regulator